MVGSQAPQEQWSALDDEFVTPMMMTESLMVDDDDDPAHGGTRSNLFSIM